MLRGSGNNDTYSLQIRPIKKRPEDSLRCRYGGERPPARRRRILDFYTVCAIMERMNQKRAYKYRFYPTDEQAHMLARTFGCCRYVYNWALRQRTDAFFTHGERLSYAGTAERLTTLKQQADHTWLN